MHPLLSFIRHPFFTVGLPELLDKKFDKTGDAYIDEPEIPTVPNMAIVRSPDGQSWLHTPDYRGSVAYDKETKQQAEITELGKLPDNLTLDAPKTPFDKWKVSGNAAITG